MKNMRDREGWEHIDEELADLLLAMAIQAAKEDTIYWACKLIGHTNAIDEWPRDYIHFRIRAAHQRYRQLRAEACRPRR